MTFYLKSNGANNPFRSKSENTSDKIVLCGMITWRLSSRSIKGLLTVYSCSTTEDPTVLGSASPFFVLLVDFEFFGITLVALSMSLNHFLNSNPCFQGRGGSWLKSSIVFLGISSSKKTFLYCICCNIESQLLESIICTIWKTVSSKHVSLALTYLKKSFSTIEAKETWNKFYPVWGFALAETLIPCPIWGLWVWCDIWIFI